MPVNETYLRALANLRSCDDSAGAERAASRFKLESRICDLLRTQTAGLWTALNEENGLRVRLQRLQAQHQEVEDREAHEDRSNPIYTGSGEILALHRPANAVTAKQHKVRELARLDACIQAIRDEMTDHGSRHQSLSARVGTLTLRLRAFELVLNGKTVLSFAPPLDIKKGGIREVEAERKRIQDLKADRREIEALPIPASVRRAKAEAGLGLWTDARPRVDELGQWHFPKSVKSVAWMLRELKLVERVYALDIEPDVKTGAISDAERARRIKEIDAAILLATRREEAIVGLLLEANEDQIVPRRDSDVRAILGLADDVQIPRDAMAS